MYHIFYAEYAAQFAKTIKQYDECHYFMLNFTHHAAHVGDKVAEVDQCSEQMLHELEKSIQLCWLSLYILYGSIDNHSRYL